MPRSLPDPGTRPRPTSWSAASRTASRRMGLIRTRLLGCALPPPPVPFPRRSSSRRVSAARAEGKGAYDRFRNRLLRAAGRPRPTRRVRWPSARRRAGAQVRQLARIPALQTHGLSQTREAIRKRERAVLVEGYFDHMALVRAGMEETVASMGTALPPERPGCGLTGRIVLCYDGDAAEGAPRRARRSPSRSRSPHGHRRETEDGSGRRARERGRAISRRASNPPRISSRLLERPPNETGIAAGDRRRGFGDPRRPRVIPDAILRHGVPAALLRSPCRRSPGIGSGRNRPAPPGAGNAACGTRVI
jgi:hypothetical protein